MRSDGVLYTGINSKSFAKTVERKKNRVAVEQHKAIDLKQDARVVFGLLDKEIASIPSRFKALTTDDSAETWKSTGIALNMYEQLCFGLKADITLILKSVEEKSD